MIPISYGEWLEAYDVNYHFIDSIKLFINFAITS